MLVKKYPKFACPGNPACGVASPERPTSLVEGDRYDSSVAATRWSRPSGFCICPSIGTRMCSRAAAWMPCPFDLGRSNLVSQIQFVIAPVHRLYDSPGATGRGRGHRRHKLPHAVAEDHASRGSRRQQEPSPGRESCRGACQGRLQPAGQDVGLHGPALGSPYNIFDFRVSRHQDDPDDFFRDSRCIVQGDCFQET